MSSIHSMNLRGVLYARVSEKDQTSVPDQIAWGAAACEREGIELAATFSDQGVRGGEIAHRAGLQEAVEFCAREFRAGRRIDLLLVWDPDRLSRANSLHTAAVLADLYDCGVGRLLTNSEGWIDLNSDIDRVLFNLRQDLQR